VPVGVRGADMRCVEGPALRGAEVELARQGVGGEVTWWLWGCFPARPAALGPVDLEKRLCLGPAPDDGVMRPAHIDLAESLPVRVSPNEGFSVTRVRFEWWSVETAVIVTKPTGTHCQCAAESASGWD